MTFLGFSTCKLSLFCAGMEVLFNLADNNNGVVSSKEQGVALSDRFGPESMNQTQKFIKQIYTSLCVDFSTQQVWDLLRCFFFSFVVLLFLFSFNLCFKLLNLFGGIFTYLC